MDKLWEKKSNVRNKFVCFDVYHCSNSVVEIFLKSAKELWRACFNKVITGLEFVNTADTPLFQVRIIMLNNLNNFQFCLSKKGGLASFAQSMPITHIPCTNLMFSVLFSGRVYLRYVSQDGKSINLLAGLGSRDCDASRKAACRLGSRKRKHFLRFYQVPERRVDVWEHEK